MTLYDLVRVTKRDTEMRIELAAEDPAGHGECIFCKNSLLFFLSLDFLDREIGEIEVDDNADLHVILREWES